MHHWGVFEVLLYAFQFMFTVQGARLKPETGMFVSITGLVGLIGCVYYSFALDYEAHDRDVTTSNHIRAWIASMEQGTPSWFQHVVVTLPGLLGFSICAPLALYFNSVLIAYLAVIGLCQALGFSFLVFPFCYVVGFSDERTMVQAGTASFSVLVIWGAMRVFEVPAEFLDVFKSPASVFGSIMLFFCLLIMSNKYYPGNGGFSSLNYLRRNGLFVTLAAAAILVGYSYGMAGMANTAITFLVLWVMEKYCEAHYYNEWNGWVLVLLGSIALYGIAMWLHGHPDFVVSMFQSAP